MANQRISRIIPIALTLIVVAVSIAALISLARNIFFPGDVKTSSQSDISKESLLSTAIDRSVSMTVRGKIIADESFRSYKILVTPTSRNMTIYKGYLAEPIQSIPLENNTPSYEQFVYALYKANFMKGNELTGDNNDIRGTCAAGYIYEFQISKADKPVKRLWTSTCSGSKGSFSASVGQTTNLFIAQVPDAKTLINKLWQ